MTKLEAANKMSEMLGIVKVYFIKKAVDPKWSEHDQNCANDIAWSIDTVQNQYEEAE